MIGIEKILNTLRFQSFQFYSKIQNNPANIKFVKHCVQIICIYQILSLTLHQTINYFNNGIFNNILMEIRNQSLNIMQVQQYNYTFHLLISIICNLTAFIFLLNILYKKMQLRSKKIEIFIQYMLFIASFFFNLSPVYFIAMVYHLQYLFLLPQPQIFYYLNLISLPTYILYFTISYFLKRKENIVTITYLIAPIFDHLFNYDGIWFNFILFMSSLLAFYQIESIKLKFYNILIAFTNFWVITVKINNYFSIVQQIIYIIIVIILIICFFLTHHKFQKQTIQKLLYIFQVIDKQQSQKYQFQLESLFFDHFLICNKPDNENVFCKKYLKNREKLIKNLNKNQLNDFLLQKLDLESKNQIQSIKRINISKIKFKTKENYLKIYEQCYKNTQNQIGKSYIYCYEQFNNLKIFQKTLKKEFQSNGKIMNRLKQKDYEYELYQCLKKLLIQYKLLWNILQTNSFNQVEIKIQKIINVKSNIENIFKNTKNLNKLRMKLHQIYSSLTEAKINIHHTSVHQINAQENFPLYLKIQNSKIVHVDKHFLLKYKYQQNELINESINIFLPKFFVTQHQKLVEQWNGNEKSKAKLKFLINGAGYIDIINFSLFINFNNNDTLEYINIFQQRKQKCVCLIDLVQNRLLNMSQKFKFVLTQHGFSEQNFDYYELNEIFKKVNIQKDDILQKMKEGISIQFTKNTNKNESYELRLLSDYRLDKGRVILVQIQNLCNQIKQKKQIEADNQEYSQQIKEIRKYFANQIKIPRIKLLVSIFIIIVLITSFITIYYLNKTKLNQFSNVSSQITNSMNIRLYFIQFLNHNIQIYVYKNMPHKIPNSQQKIVSIYQSLISIHSQLEKIYVTRLNQPNHYEILKHMQSLDIMEQNNSINYILDNIQNLSNLLLTKSYINIIPDHNIYYYTNTQNMIVYLFIVILIVFLLYTLIDYWKIEVIIDFLNKLFEKINKENCITKKQKIEILYQNLEYTMTQNIKQKCKKQKQNKKRKKYFNNLILKIIMINSKIIITIGICLMILIYLKQTVDAFEYYVSIITKSQIQKYFKSCQLKSLIFFMNLNIVDSYYKRPKNNYVQSQIININNIDSIIKLFNLLPIQFQKSNSPNTWITINQNICDILNIQNCAQLSDSILTTGYSKSKTYLQDILLNFTKINNQNLNTNYKVYQDITKLSNVLTDFYQYIYLNFTNQFQHYINNRYIQGNFFYLMMIILIFLVLLVIYFDIMKRKNRIQIIHEFFSLIPDELLIQNQEIRIYLKQVALFKVIKNI